MSLTHIHEAIAAIGVPVETVRQRPDGRIELVFPPGVPPADRQRAQSIAAAWRPGPIERLEDAAGQIATPRILAALVLLNSDPADAWAQAVVQDAAARLRQARDTP